MILWDLDFYGMMDDPSESRIITRIIGIFRVINSSYEHCKVVYRQYNNNIGHIRI